MRTHLCYDLLVSDVNFHDLPADVANGAVLYYSTIEIRGGSVSSQPLIIQSSGPSILIRIIWFLVIGLWLGGIVSVIAWLLNLTIIGLPLGLWLINRLPTVITLRSQEQQWRLDGNVLRRGQPQRSFLGRALYFVLVGWWLSGVWLGLAYVAVLTILLLPLAFWMYGRVGAVTTLYRS
jgi:uncharacterized membrane protein YccF (DUF307 family)